jgi:hypothetical protein
VKDDDMAQNAGILLRQSEYRQLSSSLKIDVRAWVSSGFSWVKGDDVAALENA